MKAAWNPLRYTCGPDGSLLPDETQPPFDGPSVLLHLSREIVECRWSTGVFPSWVASACWLRARDLQEIPLGSYFWRPVPTPETDVFLTPLETLRLGQSGLQPDFRILVLDRRSDSWCSVDYDQTWRTEDGGSIAQTFVKAGVRIPALRRISPGKTIVGEGSPLWGW